MSPDGTRIAFWSGIGDDWNIHIMNADGSGVTGDLYPNTVQDYDPRWSPDGSKIAFWSGAGNSHDVYVMNADGTGVTNLTTNSADDGHPEFSPDGTQIAFFTARFGVNAICLMASTGGPINCITNQGQGHNYYPSWQPVPSSVTSVSVDIKPGSFPNSINPRSIGVIPVAILTTANFDAATVDVLSVRFGEHSAVEIHGMGHMQDVNGDGRLDLVLHFSTRDSGIACGDTSASLRGLTLGGEPIQGSDSVKTVGCR